LTLTNRISHISSAGMVLMILDMPSMQSIYSFFLLLWPYLTLLSGEVYSLQDRCNQYWNSASGLSVCFFVISAYGCK